MCSKLLDSFFVKFIDTDAENYAKIAYRALNLVETENYQNYINRYVMMNTRSQKSMKLIINSLDKESYSDET